MPVKKGDTVKIHYTGTLDDGTVFDSSEGKKPLEFVVGSGNVIKGFEQGIIGMKKGEQKELKIESKNAYGDHNKEMFKTVPRDQLPKEQDPKAGMIIMAQLPTGQQLPIRIVEVKDGNVVLDMNHPLAGKNLNFKVKIEDITST